MPALAPGSRLGPYEIVAPLGAGGMGEVYRAKDTRLGRDVAVKALPEGFALDPERLARFEREAKLLASLSHANIAGIHGLEEVAGLRYLILEFVDGETLADRLGRGPLPLDEALEVGRHIAMALEAAHEAGIVHRDLKPGNIMINVAGDVKVLDFGLAKGGASAGSGSNLNLSASPTMTYAATAAGVILGTAAYMSPEQARGRGVDRRTDIWSFGCVLYECLTARAAFAGETVSDLVAQILQTEPQWNALPAGTPASLRRLLERCLRKDARERLRDIGDARLELSEIRGSVPDDAPSTSRRAPIGWITGLALVSLVAVAAVFWPRGTQSSAPIHASLLAPPGAMFSGGMATPMPIALSPDGATIAFCAREGEGPEMLWVRVISTGESRALAGTEGAWSPFFSPDGRSVGFMSGNGLKRVDVAGGPVSTVLRADDLRGATWGRDGTILFSPDSEGPLWKVSAEGGVATQVTTLDSSAGEATHRYPIFLPDGRHYLYLARRSTTGRGAEPVIYAGVLGSSERKKVLSASSNLAYASGHLLYVKDGALMAQPFDVARLVVTGTPVAIAQGVRWEKRFSRGVFAVSQQGLLAYLEGDLATGSQLEWLDRTGKSLGKVGEPADYTYGGIPYIAPDGRSAVLNILSPSRSTSEVHTIDLATGRRTRVTVDDGDHPAAIWSHDGASIVVVDAPDPLGHLTFRTLGGTLAEPFLAHPGNLWPRSASPDGRYVLFDVHRVGIAGASEILAAPTNGRGAPIKVASGGGRLGMGQFSPDGRYVAYESDESGRSEIYVVTFPEPGGKWQVSQAGGLEPRWNRNGRELFYFDLSNRLQSVAVSSAAAGLEVGEPQPLFQFHGAGSGLRYDISPDGNRFLVTAPPGERAAPAITLVSNWAARFGKR